MHAAQYLPESKIERAQAALPGRGFVPRVVFVYPTLMRTRAATCMPSGMRDRTLLRDQQQNHIKIMEQTAGHHTTYRAAPPSGAARWRTRKVYFATVTTASVSR